MGKIADEFRRLCDLYAIRYSAPTVSHGDIAKASDANSRGICFALSCLYLSRYMMNTVVRDLMPNVADPHGGQTYNAVVQQFQEHQGLRNVLRQLQQYEVSRVSAGEFMSRMIEERRRERDVDKKVAMGTVILDLVSQLSLAGITRNAMLALQVPTGFACEDWASEVFPYNGFAGRLIRAEGFYLIKMPSHYCACIVDRQAGVYAFIDVNGGEARTADPVAFEGFLDTFFRGAIAATYSKSGNTGIDHGVIVRLS